MLKVTIKYDYDNGTISILSEDEDGSYYDLYSDCSNWYDMSECLEDFIRLHIEERDD